VKHDTCRRALIVNRWFPGTRPSSSLLTKLLQAGRDGRKMQRSSVTNYIL